MKDKIRNKLCLHLQPEIAKELAEQIDCMYNLEVSKEDNMTTEHVGTKITKTFTFSSYEGGTHRTKGWLENGQASFKESLSPLVLMIRCFEYRPLGIKIKVTMEEID